MTQRRDDASRFVSGDPCLKCGDTKRYARDLRCVPCGRDRALRTHARRGPVPRDARRDWELRRNYGITLEQRNAMLAAQGGVCAICKSDRPSGKHTWSVDHDHVTGAIRGVLCSNCNTGLGLFKESYQTLVNAFCYLNKASPKPEQ